MGKYELIKNIRRKLVSAQKRYQREIRIYENAVHDYYHALKKIDSKFPTGDYAYKVWINELLRANNIKDFEIKKYDSKKVFNYIISNIERFSNVTKTDEINTLKPDTIKKLSMILAIGNNKYLLKKLIENHKKPDYFHPMLKPIIKNTCGTIIFEEQAVKIIEYILATNKYEVDLFYESINKLNGLKELRNLESSVNIIEYIRKTHCKDYIKQYKTLYCGFISSAHERGIKESKAKKLFNLLCAYFINPLSYYKNEATLSAKQLYKIGFIEFNYPNKAKGNLGVMLYKQKRIENGK